MPSKSKLPVDRILKAYNDNFDPEVGYCLISYKDLAIRFGVSRDALINALRRSGVDTGAQPASILPTSRKHFDLRGKG